ncbi:nucleolar protein dao-5-like isoform X2 [Contarinia nasturtii]|uniref:nucleolar protein dao-5-like isoform X2 n=1 Tax=Contarinia nasturtii TaxID=265458 RepID=UPI0012D3ABB5|nr:nucleolar protein dao-5-like isoform X2 [Contarinia nasturtii]
MPPRKGKKAAPKKAATKRGATKKETSPERDENVAIDEEEHEVSIQSNGEYTEEESNANRGKKMPAKKAAMKKETRKKEPSPDPDESVIEEDHEESIRSNGEYSDEEPSVNHGKKSGKHLNFSENETDEKTEESESEEQNQLNATHIDETSQEDDETQSESDEPMKKGPNKMVSENPNMPSLLSEDDDDDDEQYDSKHQNAKDERHDDESTDEESDDEKHVVPKVAVKSGKPNAKAKATKTAAKPASRTKKAVKIAETNQSDDEKDEKPVQKMPARANRKRANQDEDVDEVKKTKAVRGAKAKQEANVKSQSESEQDEPPKKIDNTRITRKKMAAEIDDTETVKRTTKSGSTVKPAAKKTATVAKKTAKEVTEPATKPTETISDSDDVQNQSIHLNMKKSSTIPQFITGAVELLGNTAGKSSYKHLRAFLEKENLFDVERHESKIRNQLKEMFADGQIVPANKIKGKPNVAVLFKLGSLKKTNMSSQKRKSIKMAAKKKAQNASKSKKATADDKVAPKKTKTTKKAEPVEELEEYDDDDDVPPKNR